VFFSRRSPFEVSLWKASYAISTRLSFLFTTFLLRCESTSGPPDKNKGFTSTAGRSL